MSQSFVPYLRVSTAGQGRSGLGIEAQHVAIAAFIAQTPGAQVLSPPFVEVESGKRADRPELAKALERCRRTGAVLLIAKLDRLSRDAHFLLGLSKAGVEFVAADMPHANRLTVTILAAVAEEEARAISARTKAALAAAKARGMTLGGVRPGQRMPGAEDAAKGRAAGTAATRRTADRAAFGVAPRLAELATRGLGLSAIARELNEAGVPAARGGAWTATAVKRAMARVSE